MMRKKATGFGTTFGSTATTTASTGFGFGSSFGGGTQQQTGFGSTFGQPAAGATAPTFGTSFGQPVASTASTFGTAFGAPASSAATPTFGSAFGGTAATGQQQQTNLFGAQASKPGLFGSTSTPSLFSTPGSGTTTGGLFGSTTTTQPAAGGLFGASTTTTPSLFGQPTSTPSLFGQPTPNTTSSLFGTNSGTTGGFGTGLFGSSNTFGSSFGATTTASTGFGGFGTSATYGGLGAGNAPAGYFGSTGLGAGARPPIRQADLLQSLATQTIASVYSVNLFNDERDDVIKKWNMLQACWGSGNGYYAPGQPPVEYVPLNPFYRFKAMGYNVIPEHDNSDGIVRIIFGKKIDELKNQQEVLKNGIAGILGNKPNLTIEIIQLRALTESQTELKVTVTEKGVTGTGRKIPATDLAAFFNQPQQKQQLTNVGVTSITPYVTPSKAELEEYLKHPPSGIDNQMWLAAIQDNPNPKKYIPVPINGFSDLRSRMLHQEYQTGLHQAFLDKVNKDIADLKTKHSSSIAQITELKQKFLEMQHRILRVLVKQESTRKLGIAIQPEEELLRGRFEMMHTQLNNPKQFKGQLNELLSNVKMIEGSQKQIAVQYRLDTEAQEEIKQLLKMEHNGIAQLVNIIKGDLHALNTIQEGMKQMVPNHS
ncbi:unnamed protein product [Acanthoscelides obtectus]|uniref:Uncharacterized protein n=1 Tax=Acanthoscelides obtectus TaxID=200917 RepID=A0A9P0LYF9_ACAOB|nr:unnamed protein product [Acanthoscelides obtectus]CAK1667818.1 Probable nucleoporin Nup54 [Acanthoscelides obtectus]